MLWIWQDYALDWAGGVSGMLRNPSPVRYIGITSGRWGGCRFRIVVLSMTGPMVSVIAVVAGLGVALLLWPFFQNGVAHQVDPCRYGVSAMLQSVIAYILQSRLPGIAEAMALAYWQRQRRSAWPGAAACLPSCSSAATARSGRDLETLRWATIRRRSWNESSRIQGCW